MGELLTYFYGVGYLGFLFATIFFNCFCGILYDLNCKITGDKEGRGGFIGLFTTRCCVDLDDTRDGITMGDGWIPMECEQDGEANFFLSSNSREKTPCVVCEL